LRLEFVVVVWAVPVIGIVKLANYSTNPGIYNMVALIALIFNPTVILKGTGDVILERGI